MQVMATGCDHLRLNIFVLIIYSVILRSDFDVGVVKCACILRCWSEVVHMARTPLRDIVAISLDFDTILWSSDALRFANDTADWIPPSATKKKFSCGV
jgi:hypothetical protein